MHNVTIDFLKGEEDVTRTGYTLSISWTMNTGYSSGEIHPIQGFPSLVTPRNRDEDQGSFPETREEHFIDNKLQEFYKKRGYK